MPATTRVLFDPQDLYDDPVGALEQLVDVGDVYDQFPTTVDGLADRICDEAIDLEARADAVGALVALTDGLIDALENSAATAAWLDPARRFARVVRAAGDRSDEARGVAERALRRTTALVDTIDSDADPDDGYDELLAARLHVPIASDLVDDATVDARTALRRLARTCLAASWAADDTDTTLARRARGTLRLHLPGVHTASFADEEIELWSTTTDELRVELAGLLAHLLVDRRTFLVVESTVAQNRYVQALVDQRCLFVESVSNTFLEPDEQLTDDDHTTLLELGWSAPAQAHDRVNWALAGADDVSVLAVADLLVDTLEQVHHLSTPDGAHVAVSRTA